MKSIKLTIIAALAAGMLLSCGSGNPEYDASGVFEATEIIVSSKVSGEIMKFDVQEGENVESGAVLGYTDTVQLALKKKQLAANLSATESRYLNRNRQIASLQQSLVNARKEQTRFEKLLTAKAVSQKQADDVRYQVEVLERELAAAKEQVESANSSISGQSAGIIAQIEQLDDMMAKSVITSPIKGVVLTKYAEQGEYTVPGKALFKVADIENIKLRAYINAAQFNEIKLGQKVKVFSDKGESGVREYEGVISWISDKAEFTPKTIQTRDERENLVYAVKISVKNNGAIKIGMYGEVKF